MGRRGGIYRYQRRWVTGVVMMAAHRRERRPRRILPNGPKRKYNQRELTVGHLEQMTLWAPSTRTGDSVSSLNSNL